MLQTIWSAPGLNPGSTVCARAMVEQHNTAIEHAMTANGRNRTFLGMNLISFSDSG
jgi:hypothetical protein